MPIASANGISIYYEEAGDLADPPLLLIMGLGGQLVAWDDRFVDALVAQGLRVIRFDNRDVGLSTWFDEAGVPDLVAVVEGKVRPPYLLSDMADDAAGLLDSLGLASAHVLGVSMGGMIAQALAISHPAKVRTLTSIMSTTGHPSVGQPSPEAIEILMSTTAANRESAIEAAIRAQKVIGSPGFDFDEATARERAGLASDRAFHPEGVSRHAVAILASPDRTAALRQLSCSTLVVHGEAAPLVDPSGGRATAAAISGAELWMVPGMGHDIPAQLHGELAKRVGALCRGAQQQAMG
jgi:pimeloyl-ACP methyl ester carboxylesterase